MELSAPKAFPWIRLPKHIQQRILSYAVLPEGPDTPLVIGNSDHRSHLQNVAVPLFLSLGSWKFYLDAVSILYHEVHMNISVHRRSSMNFLTSPGALRPRDMVSKLRVYIDIKKSLPLFDTGHTIAQTKGKLIKMNVPTALRCMKVHGRLSEVEFLLDSIAATTEMEQQNPPENYLPMAEIRLSSRGSLSVSNEAKAASSLGRRPDVNQAETVIAPAFLACRAWQSGLLPLLEDGTFRHGSSLGLFVNGHRSDQEQIVSDDKRDSILCLDGASLMRYWLGGTIMELLDGMGQHSSWIDPFTLSPRHVDNFGGIDDIMESHRSEISPQEKAMVESIELNNNTPPSPLRIPKSSSESTSRTGQHECEGSQSGFDLHRQTDDSRPEHSVSHGDLAPSEAYQASSMDANPSNEEEMCILRESFGIGSTFRAYGLSGSANHSGSSTPPVLVTNTSVGIASPSNTEFEVCGMISQSSFSLGEDRDDDSIAGYLTDSSGPDPREEETPETPAREAPTPSEGFSPDIKDYTSTTVQSLSMAENSCSSTNNTNRAMQSKRVSDVSEASRQLLNETLDVRLRDVDRIVTGNSEATWSSIPPSPTKTLPEGTSMSDRARSTDDAGDGKKMLPNIDGQAAAWEREQTLMK
ncbi:hypothetical protein diail_834 [Diaporthe ilicicola]|nr:hypothetical protein diail_834 [Diaporthe ilicicola]